MKRLLSEQTAVKISGTQNKCKHDDYIAMYSGDTCFSFFVG
jgi:hypothetical protein